MTEPEPIVNLELVEPGPTLGPTEGIKTAIVSALRNGITDGVERHDPLAKLRDNVTMEYPMKKGQWPALWVGFSVRKLTATGINNDIFQGENEGTYKLWHFEGIATVTILALSNVERDRIADSFIRMYAFHGHHSSKNKFWNTLAEQPYVYITAQKGELKPGGQSEGPGMSPPWDGSVLGYSDSYSFDLVGQFASSTYTGKLIRISEIQTIGDGPKIGEWV